MPAPATVPEFLEMVRKSGLVPANKIDELLSRHRAAGAPQTIDQAAGLLVRDALLTLFQAKFLKLGRYKRFTVGSKYRLLELIGAGGMGAVYLCEHTLMRRLVALKVLPTDKLDDQSNLERFYREARAVAALDHPNIVRAYDIDQYEKLHFLVMEYVDGHSLQEIVGRYAMERKRFDPIRAAHYVAQAAVGMQHAHELGMVHRDIKPGNLLLDRSGVIKVLDMGLARFFNKQQDSVTEKYDDKCVLGTADYLAPEQAVTNVVDVRADIYSLGGTLYFMLTGQTPFPDGTIAAKLVAHQTREPQPVEELRPDVPAGILAVLRKMMAKRPEDRYPQPIEVAEALAEWTEQPIAPPPEREMPHLCPLVQALLGPMADRSGAQPSLARVLFSPGRGVFTRGPGGSSAGGRARPAANGAPAPAAPSTAAAPGARPAPRYAPEAKGPVAKPISTARASAAPTAPLPPSAPAGSGLAKAKPKPRAKPDAAPAPLPPVPAPRQVRAARLQLWWIAAGGVALVLMSVAAVVVAYQLGKGNTRSGEGTPTSPDAPRPPEAPGRAHPVPGAADRILKPHEADEHVGEEKTVEFRVESAPGAGAVLKAEPPEAFAVRFAPDYFPPGSDPAKARAAFAGRRIRVRGTIQSDRDTGLYIEASNPQQIVVVAEK
jgi:tRNA A-37 threonylcarbamoyl transferase component Bud32